MTSLFDRTEYSDIRQEGENNTQQIGTINNYYSNESRKSGIIQKILQNIIELSVNLDASEPDVKSFSLIRKIEHNKIIIYKRALDFFLINKFIIQSRLDVIESLEDPLATKKLFTIVRNLYYQNIMLDHADDIIKSISEQLKDSLNSCTLEIDDLSFIPSIIFYVFSECQIFEKPPNDITLL